MNHDDVPELFVVNALIAERLAAAEAERLFRGSRRISVVPRGDPAIVRVGRLLIGLGESLSGRAATEDPCAGAGVR